MSPSTSTMTSVQFQPCLNDLGAQRRRGRRERRRRGSWATWRRRWWARWGRGRTRPSPGSPTAWGGRRRSQKGQRLWWANLDLDQLKAIISNWKKAAQNLEICFKIRWKETARWCLAVSQRLISTKLLSRRKMRWWGQQSLIYVDKSLLWLSWQEISLTMIFFRIWMRIQKGGRGEETLLPHPRCLSNPLSISSQVLTFWILDYSFLVNGNSNHKMYIWTEADSRPV